MSTIIDYAVVLKDLKEKRKKIDAAIAALEVLEDGNIVPFNLAEFTLLPQAPKPNGKPKAISEVTMLDAAYEVLKQEGQKLHASVLAQRLNANYGKETHSSSIAARLPQDKRKRFINIGQNTWELAEWADEK